MNSNFKRFYLFDNPSFSLVKHWLWSPHQRLFYVMITIYYNVYIEQGKNNSTISLEPSSFTLKLSILLDLKQSAAEMLRNHLIYCCWAVRMLLMKKIIMN